MRARGKHAWPIATIRVFASGAFSTFPIVRSRRRPRPRPLHQMDRGWAAERQASAAHGAIRLACRVKPERCGWRMPDTVVYCSWDEASPRSIPPRSYLYRVTPMGVGSANVESLTSYLARLAAAHDISPAVLL